MSLLFIEVLYCFGYPTFFETEIGLFSESSNDMSRIKEGNVPVQIRKNRKASSSESSPRQKEMENTSSSDLISSPFVLAMMAFAMVSRYLKVSRSDGSRDLESAVRFHHHIFRLYITWFLLSSTPTVVSEKKQQKSASDSL